MPVFPDDFLGNIDRPAMVRRMNVRPMSKNAPLQGKIIIFPARRFPQMSAPVNRRPNDGGMVFGGDFVDALLLKRLGLGQGPMPKAHRVYVMVASEQNDIVDDNDSAAAVTEPRRFQPDAPIACDPEGDGFEQAGGKGVALVPADRIGHRVSPYRVRPVTPIGNPTRQIVGLRRRSARAEEQAQKYGHRQCN